MAQTFQVFDNRIEQRNAFGISFLFHYPFRVARNQHRFLASLCFGIPEGGDPVIHVLLEFGCGPESIYPHGAEEMTDAGTHRIGRYGKEGHEGRHPGAVIGARKHSRENIDDGTQAIPFMATRFPAQG